MTYPKYIKATDGQIGTYAYLTLGNRPVYRFEQGEYKFRAATEEELANGLDGLGSLVEANRPAMAWKQLSSTVWEAVGRYGKFRIERSRGLFWVHYASEDLSRNFRPKAKLSEAKDFCERSTYWEDAA